MSTNQFRNILLAGGIVALLMLLGSCQPEEIKNPYEPVTPDRSDTTVNIDLTYTGLAGIQEYVFKPTCANAGCHDGTFEPDFRTLTSSYNTLVNHPVIKNSPDNRYEFRVVPNDVQGSQLIARLTIDIDGNSGIMPLSLDPDSDYNYNKDTYIAWIERWINEGAKLED